MNRLQEHTLIGMALMGAMAVGSCTRSNHELRLAQEGLHKAAETIREQALTIDVLRRQVVEASVANSEAGGNHE